MNKEIDYSNYKVPVLVYSRVCGYYQPTSQWHAGKKEEFKERVTYDTDKALQRI